MAGANRSAVTQPTAMPNVPAGSPVVQTMYSNTPNVVYIPVPAQKRGFNGWGVAAFVLSLIGYFASVISFLEGSIWISVALIAIEIVLIVFGFRAAKKKYLGRGLTIAALVIACVTVYLVLMVAVFQDSAYEYLDDYSSLLGYRASNLFSRLL
jgi:hypothetical protein